MERQSTPDDSGSRAPDPLEDQLTNVVREFLLTLRSLIDWCRERLDKRPREPRVEDIPIE
jgi:hypothetical protein